MALRLPGAQYVPHQHPAWGLQRLWLCQPPEALAFRTPGRERETNPTNCVFIFFSVICPFFFLAQCTSHGVGLTAEVRTTQDFSTSLLMKRSAEIKQKSELIY